MKLLTELQARIDRLQCPDKCIDLSNEITTLQAHVNELVRVFENKIYEADAEWEYMAFMEDFFCGLQDGLKKLSKNAEDAADVLTEEGACESTYIQAASSPYLSGRA